MHTKLYIGSMKHALLSLAALFLSAACTAAGPTLADAPERPDVTVTYLGNEGLLITQGDTKILMDPLYANGFGVYQMVPTDMLTELTSATGPYADIDAIFISHAHPDHFDPEAIMTYLDAHPGTLLYGPNQVTDLLFPEYGKVHPKRAGIFTVDRALRDTPALFTRGDLHIEAVRLPHAGGARHAGIENIAFRVTLGEGATIMHMGDAPVGAEHYTPHARHFAAKRTDTAFPPYWLLTTPEGQSLMDTHVNAETSIGIHVPMTIPPDLIASGADHLHIPGETRTLPHSHEHKDD
jgi:L-ascorbate metabolism protein UlaG (beta-lactamase superfamily)